MKSDSKKFEPKYVEQKKSWLFSYTVYRVMTSGTALVDVGTRVVEAETKREAYESIKIQDRKVVITFIDEL